jgi:hypothetical protein
MSLKGVDCDVPVGFEGQQRGGDSLHSTARLAPCSHRRDCQIVLHCSRKLFFAR